MAIQVYPVINIGGSPEQVVEQAGIAFEAGAEGLFLINDGPYDDGLDKYYQSETFDAVDRAFPGRFIGLNFLDISNPADAFGYLYNGHLVEANREPDALWVNDAEPHWEETMQIRLDHPSSGVIYFGGVAYKNTEGSTEDPTWAAIKARRFAKYMDVVTTSGPRTGGPPSVAKVGAIKEAIGDKPLAVAGGVTAESLADYVGILDKLLAIDGLETEPMSGIFVPDEVKKLVDLAHSL